MKRFFALLLALILALSAVPFASAYNMPRKLGTSTNNREDPNGVPVLPPETDPDFMAIYGSASVNAGTTAFNNERLFGLPRQGHLPALGWNSWNAFGSSINANRIKGIADAFIRLGLDKVGYEYVVIDDGCYASGTTWPLRNNATNFPLGFKDMSDYIHNLGLKYGMYNNSAYRTCAGQAGAYAYEDEAAQLFVDWGVDYIKYDFCSNPWNYSQFTQGPNLRNVRVTNDGGFSSITNTAAETRAANVTFVGTIGNYTGAANPDSMIQRNASGYLTRLGYPSGDNGYNANRVAGEVLVDVTVEEAGLYDIGIENSANGTGTGIGRCLQVDVNGKRMLDTMVPSTGGLTTFQWTTIKDVPLVAGVNRIRIYNLKGMESAVQSFASFKDSLINAGGSHIRYSICEWGANYPWNWTHKMGDSFRVYSDIWSGGTTNYSWIRGQYDRAVVCDKFTGLDKAWADPDMMVTNLPWSSVAATPAEERQHFTAWCIMNAPIMLGFDLSNLTEGSYVHQVITNKDVIALNQDPLGVQAKRIKKSNGADPAAFSSTACVDILVKPCANGDVAVMFTNTSTSAVANQYITIDEIIAGIGDKMVNPDIFAAFDSYYVKDLWTKEVTTLARDARYTVASLPSHDVRTIRISTTPPSEVTCGISMNCAVIAPNEVVKAFATISNDSDEAANGYILMQLFDATNKLVDSHMSKPISVGAGCLDSFEEWYTLPSAVEGYSMKAFLILDSKLKVSDGSVSFADKGASVSEKPIEVYVAPQPNTTFYYLLDNSPNKLEIYYNGETGNPSGSYLDGSLVKGDLVTVLGANPDPVFGIPIGPDNKISITRSCALRIVAYQGGAVSDVFTHVFAIMTDKVAVPGSNISAYAAAYDAGDKFVSAEIKGFIPGSITQFDLSGYPVGEYTFRFFCWDENYVPVYSAAIVSRPG
jgi:alpha-galactosidase